MVKKLELMQNQALRLIFGAVRTSPMESMLLLTNTRPIKSLVEERALILYKKLIRINVLFWDCYKNVSRHLRPKDAKSVFPRGLELRAELELDGEIVQGF
ncbi:uncharacterized protein TNCV_460751 [Trichonephila clavipes]|nr:uncharacterized protein TNCV_460751 [Trichonephila clavipes]